MKLKRTFSPGQRWISATEPELGIGSITSCDDRFLEIVFPAHNSERKYAIQSAPLKRIVFTNGEKIKDLFGMTHVVLDVVENNESGLVTYITATGDISETELSDTINISTPNKRFLAGIADSNADFQLRCRMAGYRSVIQGSKVRGFAGGRIDLLPHQVYIAKTVSERMIPRALLADETGLGKTIEAALILHRLILTGRVSRVLILVPETLVHQWFVELLRRFNTLCTLATEEILNDDDDTDLFQEEQMFIADMSCLAKNKKRAAQVCNSSWDLIIVDEVHHVKQGSKESELLSELSAQKSGLLLLSATPEQFGEKNHFSRLQLLDADRFRSWDEFCREKNEMQPISQYVDNYLEENWVDLSIVDSDNIQLPVPENLRKNASSTIDSVIKSKEDGTIPLLDLIDLYALGRVQFRNTRRMVEGFPARVVKPVPLKCESFQMDQIASDAVTCHTIQSGTIPLLSMENDPRIPWLIKLIKKIPMKILVLCGKKETAVMLQAALHKLIRIDIALFHEEMTLIQRDRNAAWFEEENGARVLISSESGSEGRNFQFCSNLVLYDLPWNPELLEQRIGRLDRIGQGSQITIYVPYIERTAHEILFRWYHDGVGSLAANIPAAAETFEEMEDQIFSLMKMKPDAPEFYSAVDKLIENARERCSYLSETLFNRRDRLLELSSFRPNIAQKMVNAIEQNDKDGIAEQIALTLFDHYGVIIEEAGPDRYLMLTESLTDHAFPIPRVKRPMITFDRSFARTREDVEFLTIDHPMITGALDLYLSSDHGISSFALWRDDNVMELVVECIFILECISPPERYTDRFLSSLPIRTVVNHHGDEVDASYTPEMCAEHCEKGPVAKLLAAKALPDTFSRMMQKSTEIAQKKSKPLIDDALNKMNSFYLSEIKRLDYLACQGAPLAGRERDSLRSEKEDVLKYLTDSRIRLECLRVIRRGPVS